jgi:hypothetical protein
MSNTPWLQNGDLAARWRVEGEKLVRETVQPNRDRIMEQNKQDAVEVAQGNRPKDLSFGRYLGSVPFQDMLMWQKKHPDLFSPDVEVARKALIKFWNSTEGRPYRVQKA